MARDSSLWRSRGTKKPPGAVSGGIFMPPPRMDWADAARSRLLVEQALRMIGAHVTTLVATLT